MKKKILKFLIDKAKRSKLIQSVFEQPIDVTKLPLNGTFEDSKGTQYKLYEGFRTKLKPGWERIFQQDSSNSNQSLQNIENLIQNGRSSVERMESLINIYAGGIEGKKILEIGCNTGAATYAFSEKGAKEVIGSEFSGYKIQSMKSDDLKENDLKEVNVNLKEKRNLIKEKSTCKTGVSFVDDDICNSKITPNYFDLIVSWDVLEHLHNPQKSLENIYNLLNDNGVAIHEYNPFFSLIGGHSACTIDFPWGHVILDDHDFEKFNDDIQPNKKEVAMSFYRNGLNRMTIHNFKQYCKEANLEVVTMIKFPKEQHLRMLDKETLTKARVNYPTLEINDLISYKIITILKKATKNN